MRLHSWDYGIPATYFVTICPDDRKPLFGMIADCKGTAQTTAAMRLSRIGAICVEEIAGLSRPGEDCLVHASVVMPNHIHVLLDTSSAGVAGCVRHELPRLVARLKGRVSRRAREDSPGLVVWQRSFHDHIVRNDADFARIYEYIKGNPQKWMLDRYYVEQM